MFGLGSSARTAWRHVRIRPVSFASLSLTTLLASSLLPPYFSLEWMSAASFQSLNAHPFSTSTDEGNVVSRRNANGRLLSSFHFGHALLPHPSKIHRGGEDAYFCNHALQAFGVADGVGAWSTMGIDPAKFSRSIMRFVEDAFIHADNDIITPLQALRFSYDRVVSHGLRGSCTALVGILRGSTLQIANLGDSGVLIIRPIESSSSSEMSMKQMNLSKKKQQLLELEDVQRPLTAKADKRVDITQSMQSDTSKEALTVSDKPLFNVVYRSKEQQHRFNCPYQLGLESADQPELADVSLHELVDGDLVIVGSDGLLDNLFDTDIIKLAALTDDAQELAYIIATQAQHRAINGKGPRATPFAVGARTAGLRFDGGKLDDIAVIVGIYSTTVTDDTKASTTSMKDEL